MRHHSENSSRGYYGKRRKTGGGRDKKMEIDVGKGRGLELGEDKNLFF